ncbi:MAG: hypothetical protein IKN42_00780 [Elusimicrobia bacterium]|nr:hypothetical protein [Elusimicrobiota bacterium]
MKKIITSLLIFVFFLIFFTQLYALIDVDAVGIEPSEKKYVTIKQLLAEVRQNPLKEENFKYLEKALSLCEKNSSKAEIYYLISTIKLWTPYKNSQNEKTNSSLKYDLQGAMDNIDKAISLDKNQAKYYGQKASIYSRIRDFNNAIIYCDKAIRLDPKNSDCFYERAQFNFYDKKYEDALNDVSKALEISKKPEYYYTKSFYEKELKKNQDALDDIENAIKLGGEQAINYYLYIRTRAEIKHELGFEAEEVLKDLDIVIEKEHFNQNNKYWAYLLKGKILEEHKEYSKALEAYKEALKRAESKMNLQYKIKFLEDKVNKK